MPIKLPRIGHWVAGWRLDKFFKRLFNGVSEEARKLLPLVIDVVNEFKIIIDSPIPDVLTGITKWKGDDVALARLREWMPKFLISLDIANATAHIEDPLERANAIISYFKFSEEETKNDFYHQLCYRTAEFLSDGNLTRTETIVLFEMYYEYNHKAA